MGQRRWDHATRVGGDPCYSSPATLSHVSLGGGEVARFGLVIRAADALPSATPELATASRRYSRTRWTGRRGRIGHPGSIVSRWP